ncbi:Crotonobetainyl-CoA:carnitine CoA-transferase CaiB [Roseomonas rosea]|uniref:Crotonobetainyl-CoA:carnitine CoA-transferase CaiB n=1 Tax=Muricoccus roseus TaxID=198092 RepID=A0A1M6EQ76_9PROT|nr:CoA transferase [Roseomonas rosea]SHI87651.1 Crotonobetainyl-CoA:carnitine CoA-transferase CaiB [Roseomonas rosea]
MGPLAGLRILDLTTVVMGPYATSVLGDLGADVIKVEAPGGDPIRRVGPSRSGAMGPMFLHANRSKRGIVLDLKTAAGRDALLRLAATADALVHNLRPRAMERLGLGYAALAEANPRIVYANACGYGQDGPYADRPAYDDLVQGACGIPALMARSGDDGPRYAPVNIADRAVGLHLAIALLAALRHRDRTGQGQSVEVPMFETMASLVLGDHLGGLSHLPPSDEGGYARLLAPMRRPYATADGHLCVLIYDDRHWRAFLPLARGAALEGDERFATQRGRTAHSTAFHQAVGEVLATRRTAEWTDLLGAADIPFAPMHDLNTILDDPHLTAVGFFETSQHPSEGAVRSMRLPTRWSGSPPSPALPAPGLGEHTEEVLSEIGLGGREGTA